MVQYANPLSENAVPTWLENFYFSAVTLTSIGSEVFIPNPENGGRLVETVEGILGLVILGMLVSFFSRRIR